MRSTTPLVFWHSIKMSVLFSGSTEHGLQSFSLSLTAKIQILGQVVTEGRVTLLLILWSRCRE